MQQIDAAGAGEGPGSPRGSATPGLTLSDGARVAVAGGGPAGSFFATFLLDMAVRVGREIEVDVFEPRDFTQLAPKGCNMCGGIVSESLVQHLAAEGIRLPSDVVQRGIDSYVLHMDVGSARIETPIQEKRIAAVYRGSGPRDGREIDFKSLDGELQRLSVAKGARIIPERVTSISFEAGRTSGERGRPLVGSKTLPPEPYDLLAMAVGVNTPSLKLLEGSGFAFRPPRTTRTFIREYYLGRDVIDRTVGSSMHVFLLNIPRLEFAAIIPKGSYVTICLLGESIDQYLVEAFFGAPEVRRCLPEDWEAQNKSCQCSPSINVLEARPPYADRLLLLGDCGVTRLYKDGIGAAYRAAKAAAATAVFHGVSARDFAQHYEPVCRHIRRDNRIGRLMFAGTTLVQKRPAIRRAMRGMVLREQGLDGRRRRMSGVLWDLFTGSETYGNILLRALHPAFIGGFARQFISQTKGNGAQAAPRGEDMQRGKLGRLYADGQDIVRQGEAGDSLYVIQEGRVQVLMDQEGREVHLRVLAEGEIFGEMALFDRERRSATVRALGEARVLSVDRKSLLRRFQQDPTLALRVVETLSRRVRELSGELARSRG